ncbi:hypothetical protein BX666DRAFT_2122421 [Dichotomocladium elegans]|nr:hypothetical protein BX666DRAFT_2122421 [Dichotomocladium elegans]
MNDEKNTSIPENPKNSPQPNAIGFSYKANPVRKLTPRRTTAPEVGKKERKTSSAIKFANGLNKPWVMQKRKPEEQSSLMIEFQNPLVLWKAGSNDGTTVSPVEAIAGTTGPNRLPKTKTENAISSLSPFSFSALSSPKARREITQGVIGRSGISRTINSPRATSPVDNSNVAVSGPSRLSQLPFPFPSVAKTVQSTEKNGEDDGTFVRPMDKPKNDARVNPSSMKTSFPLVTPSPVSSSETIAAAGELPKHSGSGVIALTNNTPGKLEQDQPCSKPSVSTRKAATLLRGSNSRSAPSSQIVSSTSSQEPGQKETAIPSALFLGSSLRSPNERSHNSTGPLREEDVDTFACLVKSSLRTNNSTCADYIRKIESLKLTNQFQKQIIAKHEQHEKELEEVVKTLFTGRDHIEHSLSNLSSQSNMLQTVLGNLERLEGACQRVRFDSEEIVTHIDTRLAEQVERIQQKWRQGITETLTYLRKGRVAIQEASKKLDPVSGEIQKLRETYRKVKGEVQQVKENVSSDRRNLENERNNVSQLKTALAESTTSIADILKRMKKLDEQGHHICGELKYAKDLSTGLMNRLATIQDAISELEEALQDHVQSIAKKQKDDQAALKSVENELAQSTTSNNALQGELDTCKEALASLNRRHEEAVTSHDTNSKLWQSEKAVLQKDLAFEREQKKQLQKQVDELSSRIKQMECPTPSGRILRSSAANVRAKREGDEANLEQYETRATRLKRRRPLPKRKKDAVRIKCESCLALQRSLGPSCIQEHSDIVTIDSEGDIEKEMQALIASSDPYKENN